MAIANEVILERPVSSVFSAGRVFYLVNNIVYYSQIMEGNNVSALGKCYSKNDPTAEQLNDLLETDGGTISINDADKGIKLLPSERGVLVFCDNGVWSIEGPDTGFTATNFSIKKITTYGCISPQAVVQVSNVTYYWSSKHIHQIDTNQFGILEEVSLSEDTVEMFYDNISLAAKKHTFGFYNPKTNEIEWFYSSLSTEGTSDLIYSHDRGINLGLKTGGFFPQQYNSKLVQSSTTGLCLLSGLDLTNKIEDEIIYLCHEQQDVTGDSEYKTNLAKKDDITFQDFGTDYPTAFVETGHETLGKPSNKKVAPYITTHFRKTEENWIADGSGGFELDLQSGCQMRAKWDWNESSANGRFSPPQQAYRFRRIYLPTTAEPFDSGETVITTKNKILGRGQAVSIRFEQESGKDMQLLGYTAQWSIKGRM